jgi:hypothetical protein
MAEKVTYDVEIKSNIDKVAKDVDKVNKNLEETKDVVKDVAKSTKNAEGGIKALAGGFKGMGLAIKALGIGLLLEAFNIFKDVLSKNQKVVDIFNTAIEALSIVFNDLVGFIFDKFPTVVKFFKDVFENPLEYLKKFGQLIKENLIERFNSLLDTLGYLSTAFKELFSGNFAAALDSVKKAGKESVDVLTGVDNSFEKGKKTLEEVAKAATKYGEKVLKAAAANVALKNSAQIAAAQQAQLVEKYDRQAEKLRQIRDNDLLSIADRQKANNELLDTLNEQEKAMRAAAAAQVAAAQADLATNNSIENQVALINARTNALGVEAQIEGLRSEQEANRVALAKEAIDLDKSRIEGINEVAIAEANAAAELIKSEEAKFNAQLENLEKEKKIQLERLKNNINTYALGTQARIDAEKEYNAKSQELDAAIRAKRDELATYQYNRDQQLRQDVINSEAEAFSTRLYALQKYNEEAQKSTQISEDEKRKIQKETLMQEKALQAQRISMVANTLGNISSLFEASSTEGKAFAIAQALINTYQGITAELATKTATPFEFGLKLANIATTAALGFKAVQNIVNTQPSESGGGGDVNTGAAPASAAPQFNVVGTNGVNQIAQTINKQANTPVKAYVVSKDVTTAQSLDRNIVSAASM